MADLVTHFQIRSISLCQPAISLTVLRAYMIEGEKEPFPVVEIYPVVAIQVCIGTLYSYDLDGGESETPGPFPDHRTLLGKGWEVVEACQKELKYLVYESSLKEVCELPPLGEREIQDVLITPTQEELESHFERLKKDVQEYHR